MRRRKKMMAEINVVPYIDVTLVLLIIFLNLFFLKIVKKLIKKSAKDEFELGRRHSIFLIFKYVIWVIIFAICLEVIGVKVTLLIAGSAALLVGLGFGVQQLFNDVVSGILLLVEGTIQVNDVIEVDGIIARVKQINLRASKVVTRDDVTIIIPNHKFVSENVINWSHSKGLTRFKVKVGVAYGSDVKLVMGILKDVLDRQPDVAKHKNNSPSVRFLDFGESSLDFELLFHTASIFRVQTIQSSIRCMINDEFIKHSISIPFPQRDLHIKTSNLTNFN